MHVSASVRGILLQTCFIAVLGLSCGSNARAAQTQYDSGDPTADEQLVLEMINRARADPVAEGTRLGIDITEGISQPSLVKAQQPLAINKILLQVARAHSKDMYDRAYFDHIDPDGNDPFQRMTAAGYSFNIAGENIATATNLTAAGLEDLLMVDKGISGRGHRVNLLDIHTGTIFREIGPGFYGNTTANAQGYKNFITQDFGANSTGPFVLGVVYDDKNGNGFYDVGEGLSGVTVTPDGGNFFAITSTSGGYAFPAGTSGSLTLTFSGGSLSGTVTKTATLNGNNVKVDAKASEGSGSPGGGSPGGGTPGGGDPGGGNPGGGTPGGTSVSSTNTDSDADGFPDELESYVGSSTSSATSTPTGSSAAVTQTLSVKKLSIKLNFAKDSMDSIQLSGTVPVPDNFVVNAQPVVTDVGGVLRSFTLNKKGSSPTGSGITDTFKLKVKSKKGVVAAQPAVYTLKINKGSLHASLSDEGLLDQTLTGAPVNVPVIVFIEQQLFRVTLTQAYTAKAGKTGHTK